MAAVPEVTLFSEAQAFHLGRAVGLDAWPMLSPQCRFTIIILVHCFLGFGGGAGSYVSPTARVAPQASLCSINFY